MIASKGSESDFGDLERCFEILVSLLLVTGSGSAWREFDCAGRTDDDDVEEHLFL